ncbi:MAG: tyrosine-type recombinase/integrase [Patescibacteria group bacterium]
MSVRRENRTDKKTGTVREILLIDFAYRHADGRRERIRRVAQGTTRREAEAEERAIFRALSDGTYREKGAEEQEEMPTVEAFSKVFIELYAKTENKPSEVTSKQSMLRLYILPAMGLKRLDEINTLDIDKMKKDLLASGLSPKTVKNALAVLSRLLWYATEVGHLERAPRCRFPKCPPPSFDYLSFEEAERLLATAAAKAPLWHAPFFVAMRTGLRRGELFELRWGDVQLKGRSPYLRISRAVAKGIIGSPKNNKVRTVYLTPATVAVIEQCKRAARENERRRAYEDGGTVNDTTDSALAARRTIGAQLVFSTADGSAISSNSSDWALRHVCELANVREIGWHVLRHTYASHLAMRGVPLKTIQEQLGHATMQMTLRYAHLSPESVTDAVAVLDGNGARVYGNSTATEGVVSV